MSRKRSKSRKRKTRKRSTSRSRKRSRSRSRRRRSRSSAERVDIFVFYKTGSTDKKEPDFPILPRGWDWAGSGSSFNEDMPNEIQYKGPKQSRSSAKKSIRSHFRKLKKMGIVRRYRLYNTFPSE